MPALGFGKMWLILIVCVLQVVILTDAAKTRTIKTGNTITITSERRPPRPHNEPNPGRTGSTVLPAEGGQQCKLKTNEEICEKCFACEFKKYCNQSCDDKKTFLCAYINLYKKLACPCSHLCCTTCIDGTCKGFKPEGYSCNKTNKKVILQQGKPPV